MTNEKAPAGQGEGYDQNPTYQEENRTMNIIPDSEAARQAAREQFTVGADLDEPICFEGAVYDGWLLRVHYRVERVTGRAGYVLRHFAAASEEDRARALDDVGRLDLDRGFRYWYAHDAVRRVRWSEDRRRWVEFVDMGTRVDDPLVQLELEMMIDLQSGVSA